MSIKKGLLRLFGLNNNRTASKVTDSNHQQSTIKRMHHRGYLVENATGGGDNWKAKINDKVITGDLPFIEKSIDWWCDNKTVLSPENFVNQSKTATNREIVVHQGFKIINDTGKHNGWYMLHNGQLLKGTKVAIEAKIDIAIERSRKKT